MFLENNLSSSRLGGCIEVVTGSMFSGKTEELIRRLRRAEIAKLNVGIYKPKIDNRYSDNDVVSHDSKIVSAIPVRSAKEIIDLAKDNKVVGIDEAQFFEDDLIDVCNYLANQGKRVIVAALDMDFSGKPFGPLPGLMSIAEYVTKVHAICMRCGHLANYSHRLSDTQKLVMLGEKDIYEPLCRTCFSKAIDDKNKDLELFNNQKT